jgi:hypothetical protein
MLVGNEDLIYSFQFFRAGKGDFNPAFLDRTLDFDLGAERHQKAFLGG